MGNMQYNQTMKYFTVALGCTLRHLGNIEQNFQEIIPALQNVQNPEDCDFIMAFCPVVAIKAAENMLNTLPGNKPAVLMVLHHTRDPEHIVPDSSRLVNRQNTITVDCLFYEDQGLLKCHKNNEALSKVVNWLHPKGDENPEKNNILDDFEMQGGTQSKSPYHQPSGNQILKRPRLTYFTLMTGNTLRHHVDIERKLQKLIPGLQKVMKSEESDLVLVFCPVVSRAGTDTEAAVEMLNTQAGDKPAVLVVLHHTFNAELIVPDSSRSVNRENTITVDCLFHEVQGLLRCHKNNEALSKVGNWIEEKKTRKSKNHQPSGNQMNNTENIVQDSSRSANGQNTITADCLLNEEWELLTCHENNETLSKDVKFNEEKTTRKSKNHQPSFIQTLKRPRLTYVTLMSGKTLGRHVDIEKKLQELIPGLQMVMKLEESDFILIFCPVVTQAGTDIVEALKMLNTQAGDKPAVLVVLHHTFNPELFVPDSSRLVNRENTITVDCLFYEDQGLLTCHKNNEALSKVVNWLHPKGDENPEKNNILGNFRKKLPDWMSKVTDRKNWPNLMSKDTDTKSYGIIKWQKWIPKFHA
ncbi:hypothetical protein Q7C36_022833 [Tachysurus vachellii]|uniref:Uncharacterized protein n=1 Tax=Tachysurus vachellii TaxID=175792 RepID=A0AA88ILD8_TACVA|nr:hypothetical protein Q7C36_022833 [Tachysurus vachellii]